jgi:hypothetical protein
MKVSPRIYDILWLKFSQFTPVSQVPKGKIYADAESEKPG